MPRVITHCTACAVELEPVFPGLDEAPEQYDDALEISFIGGYGMFVDPIHEELRAIICYECANKLCNEYPWIGRVLSQHVDPV